MPWTGAAREDGTKEQVTVNTPLEVLAGLTFGQRLGLGMTILVLLFLVVLALSVPPGNGDQTDYF